MGGLSTADLRRAGLLSATAVGYKKSSGQNRFPKGAGKGGLLVTLLHLTNHGTVAECSKIGDHHGHHGQHDDLFKSLCDRAKDVNR